MKYTKATIRRLFNDPNNVRRCKAIKRGILRLYSFQTADERRAHTTRHDNNLGFSVSTVTRGTELALKLRDGKFLTRVELEDAREICERHAGQLAWYANNAERLGHYANSPYGVTDTLV